MKKLILAILICSIIIVGVTAEVLVSQMTTQTTMDKQLRDYLLTKVPTVYNNQSKPLTKEIKPAITIECSYTSCKWSAVQEGLINSYDNTFDKGAMTTMQMEDYVSDAVTQRLSDYANQSIAEGSNPYIKVSTGNLTITEKR